MKKIPLTKGKYAIVDKEDYPRLALHKWYCATLSGKDYAARGNPEVRGRQILMHREIMGSAKGEFVDHISTKETLDNRRSNLRPCTRAQNNYNVSTRSSKKSSKYKGVSFKKSYGKWRAQIRKDGKLYHIGYFNLQEDAAIYYNVAAQFFFGEFAFLNPI